VANDLNIYPAIDIKGGQCVRLSQGRFDAVTTYGEDPVVVAQRWKAEGARWLHIVDLDGARLGMPDTQNRAVVARIVAETGLPVQFGGGVRSVDAVAALLDIGVARVVVGTAAARDPALAQELFKTYGEQIAVGVDARDGFVAVQGWQEHIGEQSVTFVARMADLGARRFIFTDIARDGMLTGVNTVALAQVATAVPTIPVIASGGVSNIDDIDALNELRSTHSPNIDGVIIGKALYTGAVQLSDVLARVRTSAQIEASREV
jgi:phosphoribosylformimino-5-aminoimidazole carboxamide ribotide isomerase